MTDMKGRVDFELLVTVTNANANGDPLDGNRPRKNLAGYGEISSECIKRKIRNRLQDLGCCIFVQSEDRSDDGYKSLKARADGNTELKSAMTGKGADTDTCRDIACKTWIDVRSFGQIFAFKGSDTSIGIRGPVTVQNAVSVSPIDVESVQIVKSVNGEDKAGKASDTMGTKHFVPFGLYVIKGSVSAYIAEKTGFSRADLKFLKEALLTLFENDASAARPEGSMEVRKMFWWEHESCTPAATAAEVFRSVRITEKKGRPTCFEDYDIHVEEMEAVVKPEIVK